MDFDYIFILSAESPTNGKFSNVLNGMYHGGEIRMDAAAKVCAESPRAICVAVGGHAPDGSLDTAQTGAIVSHLQAGGATNLATIETLPCTRHNIAAMLAQYGEKLRGQNYALLTSRCHFPRALRFWSTLTAADPRCRDLALPQPIVAEDILPGRHVLDEAYAKRLESELNGVVDIELGRYRDKCLHDERYQPLIARDHALLLAAADPCYCGSGKAYGVCHRISVLQ